MVEYLLKVAEKVVAGLPSSPFWTRTHGNLVYLDAPLERTGRYLTYLGKDLSEARELIDASSVLSALLCRLVFHILI